MVATVRLVVDALRRRFHCSALTLSLCFTSQSVRKVCGSILCSKWCCSNSCIFFKTTGQMVKLDISAAVLCQCCGKHSR